MRKYIIAAKLIVFILYMMSLNACTGLPKDIKAVNNFNLNEYLGTWYEVARLDHSFECGLSNVSAIYSVREDGGVRVLNKGFSTEDKEWNVAEGKAYFVDDEQTGHLKVSFFGPFYGSYVVFDLDPDYQFAYVTSYNKDYLWLLAKTPSVTQEIKADFIQKAKSKGFNVEGLIWVSHSESNRHSKD